MKHTVAFVAVCCLILAAIVRCELRRADAPVGPQAVIHFVADAEYETTHLPMSLTRLSDSEEIRIGDRLAAEPTGGQQLSAQDREIAAYVATVGERLGAQAHRKLPYRFHYVPGDWFMNGYALPGGHVYLGAGLLKLMDTEDELAAVLGHEIEHVDHYHCADRAQTEALVRHIPLGEIVGIPVEVFEAGYSKDEELEADREGTALVVKAGYSPRGAIRMFEQFEKLEEQYRQRERQANNPVDEAARVAEQSIRQYFMSHPPAKERIEQINRLIRTNGWAKTTHEKPLDIPLRSNPSAPSSPSPLISTP